MSTGKSKKKGFYFQKGGYASKKPRIETHYKGFLCSCNVNEKGCVKEAYNILNEYADKLYPKEDESMPNEGSQEEEEDIQASLRKELDDLRNTKQEKRFQSIESGAKNIIFIKTSVEDPVKLASLIVENIYETKQQQTRFLLRLIPVEVICKADNPEEIAKNFKPLAEKYFKDTPQVYSIIFNHRNNDSLDRDELIKSLAQEVTNTGLEHKVDLKGAEVSIIVEVIRGLVFLSVVPNYLKYKKFNLIVASETDKVELVGNEESK